jgi:hypothetical protein
VAILFIDLGGTRGGEMSWHQQNSISSTNGVMTTALPSVMQVGSVLWRNPHQIRSRFLLRDIVKGVAVILVVLVAVVLVLVVVVVVVVVVWLS